MSASVSSNATDLAEKFQRLTREYHKVKDMCKVLSAGVTSERAKSLRLETDLKEKEASYRKIISEKEAIEFYNNQLTKRIELLKDELDKKVVATKKKKLKPAEIDIQELHNKIKILEDDLMIKIHSNENLTNKISDMEQHESELLAEIEEQKQKVKDIQFMTKLAPFVASYNAATNRNNQMQYNESSTQNSTLNTSDTKSSQESEKEESKTKTSEVVIVSKIDAEVQTISEPNNNKVLDNDCKLSNEIEFKAAEFKRLTENIRRLEDIKEKQSIDITLLKKKLELAGQSSIQMDSAEQATKLARIRIREVMDQKEETEQTLRFFEKEVRHLEMNMKDMIAEKLALQGKIKSLEAANAIVSDELVSVRKSYDDQLSQMSDLVIELNKKITSDIQPKQEAVIPSSRSLRSFFGK